MTPPPVSSGPVCIQLLKLCPSPRGCACVLARGADGILCSKALQRGVSRVGIFSVEPKSLAHRSGAESRHVGTFICELRNRETKDASQIPPTDRLRGINNTHTHIHTPVQIAINNATLSKAFMLMSAEKQLSLHAKLHHCTKRSASFSSPSPFKVTYITL